MRFVNSCCVLGCLLGLSLVADGALPPPPDGAVCLTDPAVVPASAWERGEDHGAKLELTMTTPGSGALVVAYEKEEGGGYYTLAKSFDQPFDLSRFKSLVLEADFSRATAPSLRSINNEGHSGIAIWVRDESGKKAFFDVYSVVPLANGQSRYHYLLEFPLGPFNGQPDMRHLKSFGLQVSKTDRGGRGDLKIDGIRVLPEVDLGDREIRETYLANVAALAKTHQPNMGNYHLLVGSANQKYRFTDLPTAAQLEKAPAINLSTARQATAHAQLLFVPSVGAAERTVVLRPGDLTGVKQGKIIPAASVQARAVGHVPLKPNTVPTTHVGWYPDVVLNRDQLLVTPDKTQSAWIQIDVPAGVPADQYSGVIEVLDDQRQKLYTVPVALDVWDLDLPRENKIRTAFWGFRGMVAQFMGKPEISVEEMYPYYKLALAHRLSPVDQNDWAKPLYTIYREADNSITLDAKEFEKYIAYCQQNSNGAFNAFNIAENCWFGMTLKAGFSVIDRATGKPWVYDNAPFSADNRRIFKTVIDTLSAIADQQGVLPYAYVQPFDEPAPNEPLFPKIIAEMKEMKLRVPIEVVFAVNESIDYYPEMVKDIDILTTTLYSIRATDVAAQQGRGNAVWSYVCTGGNPLVPNQPNHDRWFFLQTRKVGATGFLNWGLNVWGKASRDAWAKGVYDGYGNADNSAVGQGDGVLVYPDATPSIRLKGLMRGVEDYQFAWLLNETYQAKRATAVGQAVASNVAELLSLNPLMAQINSGDEECIDRWRSQVAALIVKLQAAP